MGADRRASGRTRDRRSRPVARAGWGAALPSLQPPNLLRTAHAIARIALARLVICPPVGMGSLVIVTHPVVGRDEARIGVADGEQVGAEGVPIDGILALL